MFVRAVIILHAQANSALHNTASSFEVKLKKQELGNTMIINFLQHIRVNRERLRCEFEQTLGQC